MEATEKERMERLRCNSITTNDSSLAVDKTPAKKQSILLACQHNTKEK
jgi:hypothetical protein